MKLRRVVPLLLLVVFARFAAADTGDPQVKTGSEAGLITTPLRGSAAWSMSARTFVPKYSYQ